MSQRNEAARALGGLPPSLPPSLATVRTEWRSTLFAPERQPTQLTLPPPDRPPPPPFVTRVVSTLVEKFLMSNVDGTAFFVPATQKTLVH